MTGARTPFMTALYATVAWFAYFGRPTRKDEARKYLFRCGASEVEWDKEINHASADPYFSVDGHYIVPAAKKEIVASFCANAALRMKYLHRANFVARILARLPFVRCVALINSLAMGEIHAGSDIDLFIITASHRLYFVRTVAIIVLTVLGFKKTRTKIAGKICLGFFVTEKAFDFEKEKIGCDPVYLAFWLATMQPLAGRGMVYSNFMDKNIAFVHQYLPNFIPENITLPHFPLWQRCGEFLFRGWLGDVCEMILSHIHIAHTWKLPENHWPTATTIANEKILKLHAVDSTCRYRQEWEEMVSKVSFDSIS